MIKLLILSDGRAGHVNQSRAIAMALQRSLDVESRTMRCALRTGAFQRPLRTLINVTHGRLPLGLFGVFHRSDDIPSSWRPDLIVSAGGHTCAANAWLARKLGCRNVFCGNIRTLKPTLFSRIITAYDKHADDPRYLVSPTPVPIDRDELDVKAASWRQRSSIDRTCWSMLIGGDGGGYEYTERDWTQLAGSMNQISEKFNIQWLLTTSRRTGAVAETILAEEVEPERLAGVSLATRNELTIDYQEILSVADRHFCTEDSHMMISEAIASRRPVHTLRPIHYQTDPTNLHFLQLYERHHWISRHDIADMAAVDYPAIDLTTDSAPAVLDELAAKLAAWWRSLDRELQDN